MHGDKRIEGIVKHYNKEKGYGFIEVGDFPDVQDYFFHISSCSTEPEMGNCVLFEKVKDINRGNIIADNIIQTGRYVSFDYFNKQKRREIKKNIEEEKADKKREEIENSEWFKKNFRWIEKEGYHCCRCGRECDDLKMACPYCDNPYSNDNFRF